GVGAALAAAALVEQRHAPLRGIEKPPHGWVDGPAGTAVQDDAGLSLRGPALLVVDLVLAVGRQPAGGERLVVREQRPPVGGGRDGGRGRVAFHGGNLLRDAGILSRKTSGQPVEDEAVHLVG